MGYTIKTTYAPSTGLSYYHVFTDETSGKSISASSKQPNISKHLKRLALTRLYASKRSPKRWEPTPCATIPCYDQAKWITRKADLMIRRSSIRKIARVNKISKQDAQTLKKRIARKYEADGLQYNVPMFGTFDLDASHNKVSKARYAKQYPAKQTVYPSFIRFEVEQIDDNDCEFDHLGEFTHRWEPGAINHYAKQHRYDGRDSGTYKWFVPANSYESHCTGLRKMGYSKTDSDLMARSYVEQDYKRMASYGESWFYVGVKVTAYVGDTEIGSDSAWGIESDSDKACFDEVEADLKSQVMSEIDVDAIEKQVRDLQDLLDYADDPDRFDDYDYDNE